MDLTPGCTGEANGEAEATLGAGSVDVLGYLLALTVPVTTAALLVARREYRRLGHLTPLGLSLVCLMLFVPNLVLEYATKYELPATPLDYFGVLLGITGLALCLASVVSFNSVPKVFCLDAGRLTVTGFYRWSRNPQYAGFFLFLLGFALNDWSLWCLAALLAAAINLHLLILVEEEHLRRTFGEPYAEFCRKVPRYVRMGRVRI